MGLLNLALGGALGGQGGSMAAGLLPMLLQQQGGGEQLAPPQLPPQQTPDNSLMSAFSGSPQFQQQLGGIMSGQGPGMQAPIFTPPQTPMSQAPPLGQRSNQGNSFFDRMRQFRSQQF